MKYRPPLPRLILLAFVLPRLAWAQEEPPDLAKARAGYQREIETLTVPVKDRYLRVLDQMKRVLGGKGDIHGALAVQREIERVDPSAALKAFSGKWKVVYTNGDVYLFSIDAVGNVVKAIDGSQKSQGKKGKIIPQNGDFIIDWRADDRIERLVASPGGLQIDHFTRNAYPQGAPGLKATGTLIGSSR